MRRKYGKSQYVAVIHAVKNYDGATNDNVRVDRRSTTRERCESPRITAKLQTRLDDFETRRRNHAARHPGRHWDESGPNGVRCHTARERGDRHETTVSTERETYAVYSLRVSDSHV